MDMIEDAVIYGVMFAVVGGAILFAFFHEPPPPSRFTRQSVNTGWLITDTQTGKCYFGTSLDSGLVEVPPTDIK